MNESQQSLKTLSFYIIYKIAPLWNKLTHRQWDSNIDACNELSNITWQAGHPADLYTFIGILYIFSRAFSQSVRESVLFWLIVLIFCILLLTIWIFVAIIFFCVSVYTKYAILVTTRVDMLKILTFEGHIFVISALYAYSRFLAIIGVTVHQ